MKNTVSKLLLGLLVISISVHLYQYYFPRIEKGDTVYLPSKKESTIINQLPKGNQSATVKQVQDHTRETQNAQDLIKTVKGIPDLENEKKIVSLMAANMKLELNLTEANMISNDKENQRKKWEDMYNKIFVDNLNNTASVISEISPKIAVVEKREKFYLPKEFYTVMTSENPSAKFYGLESYTFKNPKQKDFVELNLKLQGLYLNQELIPNASIELLFNPDGKIKPGVSYGYYFDPFNQSLMPYWSAAIQYNLIRF